MRHGARGGSCVNHTQIRVDPETSLSPSILQYVITECMHNAALHTPLVRVFSQELRLRDITFRSGLFEAFRTSSGGGIWEGPHRRNGRRANSC